LCSRLRSYFWPSPATLTLVWASLLEYKLLEYKLLEYKLFVFTILFGIAGVYSLSTCSPV